MELPDVDSLKSGHLSLYRPAWWDTIQSMRGVQWNSLKSGHLSLNRPAMIFVVVYVELQISECPGVVRAWGSQKSEATQGLMSENNSKGF